MDFNSLQSFFKQCYKDVSNVLPETIDLKKLQDYRAKQKLELENALFDHFIKYGQVINEHQYRRIQRKLNRRGK